MFREQVVQAQRGRGTGEILLAKGMEWGALTLLFALVAASVVTFLCLASVTRKETVFGTITPSKGLLRVVPMQAGVIARREVFDGQFVHAGDILFVLSRERSSATRGDSVLEVSGLIEGRRRSLAIDESQLRLQNQERLQTAERRSLDLLAEEDRIDKQIELQTRRVGIAHAALVRHQELERSGFISSAQVEDRHADVIDQEQRLADLNRSKASARTDLFAAKSEIRQIGLQMQRDDEASRRGQSQLTQNLTENEVQRELTIRAPGSGTVATTVADVGQTVLSNQLLATIVPAGSALEVELYVPSRSVGFVKPAMPVLLRYEAFPYQKFGQFNGTVREVSMVSIRPEELGAGLVPPTTGGEPIYKLRVALEHQTVRAYGKEAPLRPGMALEASILIERRRLYEWMLDPLYSITGRL